MKWERLLEVTLISWRHTVFTADKEGNNFALAVLAEQMFRWITSCPYSEHFCCKDVENKMATSYRWKTEALRTMYWSKIWFLRAPPPAEKCTELVFNSGFGFGCAPKHLMSLKSPEVPFLISRCLSRSTKKLCHVLVHLWTLRLYKVPAYKTTEQSHWSLQPMWYKSH